MTRAFAVAKVEQTFQAVTLAETLRSFASPFIQRSRRKSSYVEESLVPIVYGTLQLKTLAGDVETVEVEAETSAA